MRGGSTVSIGEMALIGRFHPLIVHFPIALVMVAAWAEGVAIATDDRRWRSVAVINVRVGAAFAFASVIAGWRLAASLGFQSSALLEWHRWLGAVAALLTAAAAVVTFRTERHLLVYRIAVFSAATVVAVAGHVGGLLVWGADLLRP
jgi:uncharacterized membrane protein